jgi:hypothetical protein
MPPLPLDDPLGDSVKDVLGIRRDLDLARLLERKQALDRRHQFHPIVGGVGIEPEELLLYVAEAE